MSIKDITVPATEPVTLSEAKLFLRVDQSEDDALISTLIRSAREQVERHIRASLIARRRVYTTARFSDSGVFINHSPVTAVHRVSIIGEDGVSADLPLSDYQIDLRSAPAHICLRAPWRWNHYNAVPRYIEIEIDAGYGDQSDASAADIPMPLKQAVLLLLAQGFEFRDKPDAPPMPLMAEALMMPYRGLNL